jgi:hypothetical protein
MAVSISRVWLEQLAEVGLQQRAGLLYEELDQLRPLRKPEHEISDGTHL